MLDIEQGNRVLDVGAGSGASLGQLADQTAGGLAVGVDHSEVMCGRARSINPSLIEAGRVQVECAASDDLPFESAAFDAAMSVHTVYFWNPIEVHLREIARIVKDEGSLVFLHTVRTSDRC